MADSPSPLIHIHGVSVGEMLAAVPMIDSILDGTNARVLLTYWTKTSEVIAKDKFGANPRIALDRLPLDLPWNHAAFFKKHDIAASLFIDSEIWPGWLMAMKQRGISAVIVNGRMSPKSFGNWSRVTWLSRFLLNHFRRIDTQSEADTQRFRSLGAAHAATMPVNLKYLRAPLTADADALSALRTAIGDRPVVFYSCTHDGDEDMAFGVHKRLRDHHPNLLTLIVPRHPHRVVELVRDTETAGLTVARRSEDRAALDGVDILYGDTIGEMGLYYMLATLVVIGKSFNPDHPGGQNPIEGAQLGCPLLCGPYMTNFPGVMDDFKDADAMREVTDAAALETALRDLLTNPETARALGQRALRLTQDKTRLGGDYLAALNTYVMQAARTS